MIGPECDDSFYVDISLGGVGEIGITAVNHMISLNIKGVAFFVAGFDSEALEKAPGARKVLLDSRFLDGFEDPDKPPANGKSAKEGISRADTLAEVIDAPDLVFLISGLENETVIQEMLTMAQVASELSCLNIFFRPCSLWPPKNIENLIYPHDGVYAPEKPGMAHLFGGYHRKIMGLLDSTFLLPITIAEIGGKNPLPLEIKNLNDLLMHSLQSIWHVFDDWSKLMINTKFSEVKYIFYQSGVAMMGIGFASGENRVEEAVKMAMESPLLFRPLYEAKHVLLVMTGGSWFGIQEVIKAVGKIEAILAASSELSLAPIRNETEDPQLKVTIYATGFEEIAN